MNVSLAAIELDTSIQCRASIDTAVVSDYAERMSAGDVFPPVELFGSKARCWLADGWHRVLAAKQLGFEVISADLREGGRADALKYALGANSIHGHRRSNADKRRCVEIALREFPKLSSRAIAELCGVSHMLVQSAMPQVEDSSTSRTGQDGKHYPARRETRPAVVEMQEPEVEPKPQPRPSRIVLGPPADGMQFARMAIMDLEQIRQDDIERSEAFALVKEWLNAREA